MKWSPVLSWLSLSHVLSLSSFYLVDLMFSINIIWHVQFSISRIFFSFSVYLRVIFLLCILIFTFMQGKFYELYELDAEIGHKELDWKMTQSGVGKCRQVTLKFNYRCNCFRKWSLIFFNIFPGRHIWEWYWWSCSEVDSSWVLELFLVRFNCLRNSISKESVVEISYFLLLFLQFLFLDK